MTCLSVACNPGILTDIVRNYLIGSKITTFKRRFPAAYAKQKINISAFWSPVHLPNTSIKETVAGNLTKEGNS